jgi:hypothetical protein
MTKFILILFFIFINNAFAGGPYCKIIGTTKTVIGYSKNGVDWTLIYNDGKKETIFDDASFTAPPYSPPMGYTIAGTRGNDAGVLTVHIFSDDIDHSFSFYTHITDGNAEVYQVSCLEIY